MLSAMSQTLSGLLDEQDTAQPQLVGQNPSSQLRNTECIGFSRCLVRGQWRGRRSPPTLPEDQGSGQPGKSSLGKVLFEMLFMLPKNQRIPGTSLMGNVCVCVFVYMKRIYKWRRGTSLVVQWLRL